MTEKGKRLTVWRGMLNECMAVIERDGEWYIAYCPEVPGANGQGRTREECLQSLKDAIKLVLQDQRTVVQ